MHPGAKQQGHLVSRADYFGSARQSVTAVTSVWSDGTHGPLGLCVPEQMFKDSFIEEYNRKHSGEMFIFSSESRGHFMVAGTFLTLCHGLLTAAFSKQRQKYHLDPSTPGLLLADAWSGFHAYRDGSDTAREAWMLV